MGCFSPCFFTGTRRRRRRLREKATVIPSAATTTTTPSIAPATNRFTIVPPPPLCNSHLPSLLQSHKADDEAFQLTDSNNEASTTNSGSYSSPSSSSKKIKNVFFDLRETHAALDSQVFSSVTEIPASKSKIHGDWKGKREGDEETAISSSNYNFLTVCPRDPNSRYGDFSDSEEEYPEVAEDVENERQKVQGNKGGVDENETSGSLFSISVGRAARISARETDEKEVSSPMSPLIKLGQDMQAFRSIQSRKSKGLEFRGGEIVVGGKLGVSSGKEEEETEKTVDIVVSPMTTPVWHSESDHVNAEMVVDASLSAWIEDQSPSRSKKKKNAEERGRIPEEDRPILGALTVEELKFIENLSPSSPTRKNGRINAEDSPIIGTVGSYWKHTSRTMDSVSSSSPRHSSVSNTVILLP